MPAGHRIVVLDLLGYGRSDRPRSAPVDVRAHAIRVVEVLDELRFGRACVVGHGIGGGIAQSLAIRHTSRVSRLCLVDSVAFDRWPTRVARVARASLGALDERIASLSTETETAERDRRLSLLRRQRASLHDLLERRRSLAIQLESAGLMLQNLKLDLLKFRSAGIGSSIEDVSTATQEARALSRDIGNLVEASDDLRKL
jgi:pimeloyl-ACP methyl ester carboxylesterase